MPESLKQMRAKYGAAVEEAIGLARASSGREVVKAPDGAEAYAYPQHEGRIAWGVNAAQTGVNIWRGIRLPDGRDEAEMCEMAEGVSLEFIGAQLDKLLDGQRETNGRLDKIDARLNNLDADMAEVQVSLATTRADLGIVKADVEAIKADVEAIREVQQNQGARLNVIDGRLAIIERQTGLVKA
jgi:hypothetical protein